MYHSFSLFQSFIKRPSLHFSCTVLHCTHIIFRGTSYREAAPDAPPRWPQFYSTTLSHKQRLYVCLYFALWFYMNTSLFRVNLSCCRRIFMWRFCWIVLGILSLNLLLIGTELFFLLIWFGYRKIWHSKKILKKNISHFDVKDAFFLICSVVLRYYQRIITKLHIELIIKSLHFLFPVLSISIPLHN